MSWAPRMGLPSGYRLGALAPYSGVSSCAARALGASADFPGCAPAAKILKSIGVRSPWFSGGRPAFACAWVWHELFIVSVSISNAGQPSGVPEGRVWADRMTRRSYSSFRGACCGLGARPSAWVGQPSLCGEVTPWSASSRFLGAVCPGVWVPRARQDPAIRPHHLSLSNFVRIPANGERFDSEVMRGLVFAKPTCSERLRKRVLLAPQPAGRTCLSHGIKKDLNFRT